MYKLVMNPFTSKILVSHTAMHVFYGVFVALQTILMAMFLLDTMHVFCMHYFPIGVIFVVVALYLGILAWH